ncbi:MAG: hypothetical protein WCS52_15065 [bacterium]
MSLLLSMFCLGLYTLLAQMLVTRELAVVCLGNELTIGVVFSVWLLLVGAGARLASLRPFRLVPIVPAFLWLAVMLPLVMLFLQVGAGWLRLPGEYVALHKIFAASFLALFPICVPAGMLFPLGCEALSRRGFERPVSGVYTVEALGCFVAGVLYSFWLIGTFSLFQIALFASATGFAGAACVARHLPGRKLLILAAGSMLVCGLSSSVGGAVDWRTVQMRWASLGIVHDGKDGRPAVTLRAGCDTRYQNLALLESGGLFSLYGDGEVMFSFPDPITSERAVNFVMAQKPEARRVLLLGGNPAGELPYLLAYPVREVVWVERDPALEGMVRTGAPGLYNQFVHDSRLRRVCEDGPRFVKYCQEQFDVILVHAPEPVTGSLNRLYTREFYGDVSRILAPGGFLHTSIEASERLETDASRMAGSIYRTLKAVFPVVNVTAGTPIQFFASGVDVALSMDRDVLYRRSRSAPVTRGTFRPEYLLDADELDAGKMAFTVQRLTRHDAPENTIIRPVSCYYTLILWSRYSHSLLGPLFREMAGWRPGWGTGGVGGVGLVLLGLAAMARRKTPAGLAGPGTWQVMAVTGFGGVALELILLYAFQGMHGYVYSRMGFMVGLFMLGAVTGAWQVRSLEKAGYCETRGMIALCLLLMGLVAWVVRVCLMNAVGPEWLLYGLTLATGAVVAMQFIAVSRLLTLKGAAPAVAAGRVWLADYWGSALGGFLAGIFLMPVLGIGVTCDLLLMVFTLSLLLFAVLTPRHPE